MTYWLNPDRSLCSFSSLFGQKLTIFPFLGIYPRPWMHHPTILTTTPIFFWFSPYFIPVFHLEMKMFPYLEMPIGSWKQCPSSIITNLSLFFFFCFFFLYFIAIFHPEKYFFPYLEVCTGSWNSTHPSPVMTMIPTFFVIFFCYFIDIFHSAYPHFPNLEMCAGPWIQCPIWSPTILYFFLYFSPDFFAIFLLFLLQHSHSFHIWKCALDPEYNAQYGHQPSPIFFWFFRYFIAILHSA